LTAWPLVIFFSVRADKALRVRSKSVESINRNNAEAPSIIDLRRIFTTNSAKQTFDHGTALRSEAATSPRVLKNFVHQESLFQNIGFLLENGNQCEVAALLRIIAFEPQLASGDESDFRIEKAEDSPSRGSGTPMPTRPSHLRQHVVYCNNVKLLRLEPSR
jgi:hypothetical protein